jgi:hypothetical protein
MITLVIKGTAVTFRMTVDSTESLLALTRHVAQQQLLLTADELAKGHPGKDFKDRCD